LKWSNKSLLEANLSDIQISSTKHIEDNNLFENVYVYDLETYANEKD